MSKNSTIANNFQYNNFIRKDSYEQIYFAESPVSISSSHEGETPESSESFSDLVLEYISKMLMGEEMDDNYDGLQRHPDLEATERNFYELIGGDYSPSPDRPPLYSNPSPDSSGCSRIHGTNISDSNFFLLNSEFTEYQNCEIYPAHPYLGDDEGFLEDQIANVFGKILPASELEKEVEEANKIFSADQKLVINVGEADLNSPLELTEITQRQKNRQYNELDNEGTRRSKLSAISSEEPAISSELLDEVLLCSGDKYPMVVKAIREKMYNEANKESPKTEPKYSADSRKSLSKKQLKEEEADINTLLLHCAQTVATGDYRRAYELLRQIRQHSSPHGDASQRVAHYVADGLEARLAGTGSEVYHSLISKRRMVSDALSAFQLYLASCPFKKITYHFANQTILETIQNATRVHIIDFGIYFGFQWPVFLKILSARPGGPPKLRITGIDVPQPGFRPTEMVDETGRRLANYAERFGIPFEYHGIAAKFDEINVEKLHIKEDEILVVNCLLRLHCPADETVHEDCPRDKVLKTIRELNPAVFVNVVVNGTYGAPFFMTRFREALYHFSAVFDMLHMTTPRESERRLLVERDLYGRLLMNAIACEGLERERPETYKQWKVRCLRAGFQMAPISKEFVKKLRDGVRSIYHKDFNMDEDGRWLLIGWKGRILYALSAWKPLCRG